MPSWGVAVRIRTLVAAVSFIPSLANAAEPIHLAPATPWVIDYAENSCRLIRRFGAGKDLTIFALESEAPGAVDMMIVGNPLYTTLKEVPARFLPLQAKSMLGNPGRTAADRVPMVLWSSKVRLETDEAATVEEKEEADRKAHPNVRPPGVSLAEQAQKKAARLAFAESTTAVEIDVRRDRPVILDTGSLGAAIKIFDQCSRDSLRDWGVNPDLNDKIVREVWAPRPEAWFSALDYPNDMFESLKESVVKARLLVDATGGVTKCTALSHFDEPEFNRITCAAFTARGHFQPAELADGTKVPSYYVVKVVFKLAP